MPLSTGDQLGLYEILSAIGAGGLGEVYKARDTRLDRTVAGKVLPEHITKCDDLRARFERDAMRPSAWRGGGGAGLWGDRGEKAIFAFCRSTGTFWGQGGQLVTRGTGIMKFRRA